MEPIFGFLTHSITITKRKFVAVLLLFSPTFAWFYAINMHVFLYRPGTGPPNPYWVFIGEALFLMSIVCSAIIGSMISEKWNRKRFLGLWILFGVLTTPSFVIFEGPMFFLLLSVFAGISVGIGFPSCLAFLADSTTSDERARVSGAVLLAAFVALILIIGITSPLGLVESLLILTVFRALSFFALLIDPCEKVPVKKKTWLAVLTTPGFGFYSLSWLMFWAAGGTATFVGSWLPASPEWAALESLGMALIYIGAAFAGLLSGFVSDRFGRKKTIILGLATLGISYALFGVTTHEISYLITQLFFGASWGIIFGSYFMTVIGDFASTGSKERFYAIGSVGFLFYMILQLFSEVFSTDVAPGVVSSILSIVLFAAVIPLLYAPETLPQNKIRRRRFREHLKKIEKVIEEERTQPSNA